MTDDLRQHIADAIRASAHACDGKCGLTEEECAKANRILVSAWTFGVVSCVEGEVDDLAAVAAAVAQPIADARDRLAAGVPLVCSDDRHEAKVRGLEADRDRLREVLDVVTGQCRKAEAERDRLAAAVQRVRAEIARLDRFAEATISVPDRSLYLALADALRAALDGPAPAADICELPHHTIEEEEACEASRLQTAATTPADRTADEAECCGAEPPPVVVDADGREWRPGDCWCTLPPDHEGDCLCGPCAERHGAPGWSYPPEPVAVERELTPAELVRYAQSGVASPGCDCGHDGMGEAWHANDCAWRSPA